MAKEKMVKIRLPLIKGDEVQEDFVGVNGKFYKIKRGVAVDVPESVEENIRHSEQQDYKAEVVRKSAEDNSAKDKN